MKQKLIILGLILALVALPLAACAKPAPAPAPAPAPPPVTEEWTYIVASSGPEVESVKAFSDELRKRTNNQSPILVPKTRGELGMKGQEILDAISGGVLKVGHVLGNYVGGEEPLLATGGLPFLYSKKESRAAIEAARPFAEDVLNKHGLKLLYIAEFPNIVWSKIPWESVDVIPKLKFRTSSKPAIKAMEALGAQTIILQSAEIYTSMTTGLINSFSFGPMSGSAKSFYEVSDYLYLSPIFNSQWVFGTINQQVFNSLSPEVQKAMVDLAKEYELPVFWESAFPSGEGLAKLEANLTVIDELPPEIVEYIRENAVKSIWKEWAAQSPEVEKQMDAIFAALGRSYK